MSLIATSAASRHLSRRILSTVNADASSVSYRLRIASGDMRTTSHARARQFSQSGSKGGSGSGLRRTQNKARRTPVPKSISTPQPKTASTSSSNSGGSTQQPMPSYEKADPHLIANEMVSRPSAEGRTPGTESVATLTKEQKISNFAMAGGLLAFVSYVFYYSVASVGGDKNAKALIFGSSEEETQQQQQLEGEGNNPGFDEFLKEANEGRSDEERRVGADEEARGEALEMTRVEGAEGVIAVGSMTEEEERAMARTAGFEEDEGEAGVAGKKKRPLWKRVVFFWRRE